MPTVTFEVSFLVERKISRARHALQSIPESPARHAPGLDQPAGGLRKKLRNYWRVPEFQCLTPHDPARKDAADDLLFKGREAGPSSSSGSIRAFAESLPSTMSLQIERFPRRGSSSGEESCNIKEMQNALRVPPSCAGRGALSVASTAFSQVVPAATTTGGLPISVGAGVSDFNRSFDNGFGLGDKLWIDFGLPLPQRLHGLGIEAEGEQVGIHPAAQDKDGIREEVASCGATYSPYDFRKIDPYIKFLLGYGNVDYPAATGPYHQTRTVYTAGGGATYPLFAGLSARMDYEYQLWPNFWVKGPSYLTGNYLTPYGFAVGASYQINRIHLHF